MSERCDCNVHVDIDDVLDGYQGAGEFSMRAQARAVEEGHYAWEVAREGDHVMRYRMVSNCRHHPELGEGRTYEQRIYLHPTISAPARGTCTCEAGRFSRRGIPCKHVTRCMMRLEREGRLKWNDGRWWHPDALEAKREFAKKREEHWKKFEKDPFEGLIEKESSHGME